MAEACTRAHNLYLDAPRESWCQGGKFSANMLSTLISTFNNNEKVVCVCLFVFLTIYHGKMSLLRNNVMLERVWTLETRITLI